jgi:hypothetical protein
VSSSSPAAAERQQRFTNLLIGWTVYPAGDLIAQLISREFSLLRLVIMAIAGGVIYRFEVPRWFRLLDRYQFRPETLSRHPSLRLLAREDGHLNWLGRTMGAILYFNPLWIARHMLFIRLGTNPASFAAPGAAVMNALLVGTKSFLVNLPISIAGNYVIQMRLPLRWRFLGSSIFSGLLAAAYALAYRYF